MAEECAGYVLQRVLVISMFFPCMHVDLLVLIITKSMTNVVVYPWGMCHTQVYYTCTSVCVCCVCVVCVSVTTLIMTHGHDTISFSWIFTASILMHFSHVLDLIHVLSCSEQSLTDDGLNDKDTAAITPYGIILLSSLEERTYYCRCLVFQ